MPVRTTWRTCTRRATPQSASSPKRYARYDCAMRRCTCMVFTTTGWKILPSNADNYVKIGQTDKRVDGIDRPIQRRVPRLRREAGMGGVLSARSRKVHRGRECSERPRGGRPRHEASTSAVAGRRLDVVIDCTPTPTPTPTALHWPPPRRRPTSSSMDPNRHVRPHFDRRTDFDPDLDANGHCPR